METTIDDQYVFEEEHGVKVELSREMASASSATRRLVRRRACYKTYN
jgi:hypothetical protein